MERRNTDEVIIGRAGGGRQSDLLKSFRLAVRPILTCCSYEDFTKGFSRFNGSEQQSLRHLFIQVITSLHKMIECHHNDNTDYILLKPAYPSQLVLLHSKFELSVSFQILQEEFKSLCIETQVGTTLDTVEQLVEEQSLDPLFSDRTNVFDVARDLSMEKEKEIRLLMGILERAEERNRIIGAHIELLKKGRQDVPGTADTIEKLRRVIVDYGTQ